jgi:hypothetical protein
MVELLIGVSLSLIVITAVLSSYVFLARNFTRSIGLASSNKPSLVNQSRIAVTYLSQDVRMATGITGTLSASEVTLIVPTNSGTKNITYYYNSSSSSVTVYSVTVEPTSFSRIDRSNSTLLTLQTNLLTCTLTYYDGSGYPYTTYVNYLKGIKSLALSSTAQAGSSVNGTLSAIYQTSSAPLVFRNKSLL